MTHGVVTKDAWFVFVPPAQTQSTLRLFSATDAYVSCVQDGLWLQLDGRNETHQSLARQLPTTIFRLTNERWLVSRRQCVARTRLPELEWRPIAEVVEHDLPVAALAANKHAIAPVQLRLIPAAGDAMASAAIFEIDPLSRWVETAPTIRLSRLHYATCGQRAFVEGQPLPPLDGQLFGKYENIIVPLGLHWSPAARPSVVASIFGVGTDELLIWQSTHHWSVLPRYKLAPLTRSSIRLLQNG